MSSCCRKRCDCEYEDEIDINSKIESIEEDISQIRKVLVRNSMIGDDRIEDLKKISNEFSAIFKSITAPYLDLEKFQNDSINIINNVNNEIHGRFNYCNDLIMKIYKIFDDRIKLLEKTINK